ncbi:MAG: hypothetical protein L0H83_05640 [Salinisphaera sp.]|nr:hypothetical protein [Salinisphaera sp.]
MTAAAIVMLVLLAGCARLHPPQIPAPPHSQLVLNVYPGGVDPDYVLPQKYVAECQMRDQFLPPVGEVVTQGQLQIMLSDTTDLLKACAALQQQSIDLILRQTEIIRGAE